MANTERRSRTKRGIFIAIALVLIVYLIGATYARYSTEGKATGTIQVAKWAVAITADDGTTLTSTTQPITFTVQTNTNVVPNKIAPAVTAVAEVELDLAGTEVAVDFDAVIDSSAIANLGASSDKLVFTTKVDLQNIKLDSKRKFYTDKDYDTTIIEIKENSDEIKNFLELDDKLMECLSMNKNEIPEFLKNIYLNKS